MFVDKMIRMSFRHKLIFIYLPSLVAMVLILGLGYTGLSWVACSAFPDETTDVAAYTNTLKDWSATGLVSHFPLSVPPHAKNVKFAAHPKILQGGTYIQLRMQLPADEIAAIEKQFEKTATVYDGSYPPPSFRTSDDSKATLDFPSHYTLYVLSVKDHTPPSWNHGEKNGAAVSTADNEVVYWAEAW